MQGTSCATARAIASMSIDTTARVRDRTKMTDTSVGLLADRARRYPDRPFVAAMRRGGAIERYTYREGVARVVGVADWLRAFGLGKGDPVVAYLDIGDPGLWFYLGCAALGVIPVPIGPAFSADAVAALAKQARAKAVFTLPEFAGRLGAVGV